MLLLVIVCVELSYARSIDHSQFFRVLFIVKNVEYVWIDLLLQIEKKINVVKIEKRLLREKNIRPMISYSRFKYD